MRLIDADALLDGLEELFRRRELNAACTGNRGSAVTWNDAIFAIKSAPTAQPQSGRWEMKSDPYGFFDEIPVCSECGCTTKMREVYKFCPNCGADMRGEQE